MVKSGDKMLYKLFLFKNEIGISKYPVGFYLDIFCTHVYCILYNVESAEQ